MTKEKKYFLFGTDEEVLLGDVVSTTLEKDFKDGRTIHREVEFTLTEETLPLAVKMEIIEEKEVDSELEDFDSDYEVDEAFDELYEIVEKLEKRVEAIEEKLKKPEQKPASPKKK